MEQIFSSFGRAIEGTPLVALAAAFLWGILSMLLSPCHLTSIPLVVGFINKQGELTARRAFWISLNFSLGILISIAIVGAATAAAGRVWGDTGSWGNYLVAAVLFAVGLILLDVLPMPWSAPGQLGVRRKGLLAALLLGLIFGIALGPCTFAFMAPLLAVVFKLAAGRLAYAILLVGAYGIGHCLVIVLAGTFTEMVQRYLSWNEKTRGAALLRSACGALVIGGGLYLIYAAP